MNLRNKTLLKDQGLINGAWVDSSQNFAVTNPATGDMIAQVADGGAEETRAAIDAAKAAFPAWAGQTAAARSAILKKFYDVIVQNVDDLAEILHTEQGKPVTEARSEILGGAAFIQWFAEEAKRAYGDVIPSPIKDTKIIVQKHPIGVCGLITPWNFPSSMIARKIAPALAAGCTVVLKPASETPLSALALGVLAVEAGVPAGVFNIVTTTEAAGVGRILCESADVRKISFTGSTAVGKILYAQCAGTVKKLSLELGGNAPFIVFDDADLDAAVQGALHSKFRNAGQTCICANRIYVQAGVFDKFTEKFVAATKALDLSPLINEKAVQKVESLLADAQAKGARVLAGGQKSARGGNFFEPTVVCDVTSDMRLGREEIFGPLAPLFKFTDEADVIAQANDTAYGLASYFYARDLARVWRVADALEYGMVAVNSGALSLEVAPFGGVKESGIGREGSHYGLDEYLDIKYILMGGL